MKLEKLVECREVLDSIAGIKMEAQKAWDLSIAVSEARKHLKIYDEKRDAIVKEFGKPDPNHPDRFTVADIPAFSKEMKALEAVEVDIKFPDFGIAVFNGSEVTASEIGGLRDLGILTKKK